MRHIPTELNGFKSDNSRFDLNHNGRVDFSDVFIFADFFGEQERAKLLALAFRLFNESTKEGLGHVYPNPFNTRIRIPYFLKSAGNVELAVYNPTGQLVRRLIHDTMRTGFNEVVWSGLDEHGNQVGAGTYLVVMRAKGMVWSQKALFVK